LATWVRNRWLKIYFFFKKNAFSQAGVASG